MKLLIEHMANGHCVKAVKQTLTDCGFKTESVIKGSAIIYPEPQAAQLIKINTLLEKAGFALNGTEACTLSQRIKALLIEKVHFTDLADNYINFSDYLANAIYKDYPYLSRTFSETEGITIEKFIIQQKVEKVKSLLATGNLTLNSIAYKMGYSSGAHLSAQFKRVVGQTPSQFKTNSIL